MAQKNVLTNPIDHREIWIGLMIGMVAGSIVMIWETLESGVSLIALIISVGVCMPLGFFGWTYRQIVMKPRTIEIQGDCLILHFRFKSNPIKMKLEDIEFVTVSLDGNKIGDWRGYDAIVSFKEKLPVVWFPLYWKSAIVVREEYRSRFGEYPPMREIIGKKTEVIR